MKLVQKISVLLLPLVVFVMLATPVFADNVNPCEVTGSNEVQSATCKLTEGTNNFGRLIGNAVTIILVVAAIIALFYLVWGGVKWILSGGDKAKVEAARGTIIAAIIGLIITFLAYFILNFVLSFFGLDLGSLAIPNLNEGVNSGGAGQCQGDNCLQPE